MIGIGVIGYGYWGPNLVRNFGELPGFKVISVCDFNPQRLAQVSARYPAVKTTVNYQDLLKDQAIDAMVIATPVSTHFELAIRALQAGKHVFLEKPMTATVEEGERLLDAADHAKRILMVDHTFIYTGAIRKIKDLVTSGQLGDLYYYDSVRVNLGLFQHDVNVLWDLAVHDLSIMDYLLEKHPCAVAATGISHVPGQPEDVAYLTCFFDNSLIAHFHVNWLAPVKVRQTLVGGALKMIVYDDLEPSEKVKVYDKGITLSNGADGKYQLLVGYRSGDMWAPQLVITEALRVEAIHFGECIDNEQKPITDGQMGLRVVRILEAATKSLAQRGMPIELNCEVN
jgi:predicted dehydrogenase